MDLEGPTNVDALIINSSNGFAIVTESKVLSDISYQVSYDLNRNQIIRNIDVMLESNKNLNPPLNERIPEKTLFLLLTPEVFKKNPKSRLYGNKFNDYKRNIDSIKSDLPHRDLMEIELESIQKRIGWISWEEIKRINPDCCKWL